MSDYPEHFYLILQSDGTFNVQKRRPKLGEIDLVKRIYKVPGNILIVELVEWVSKGYQHDKFRKIPYGEFL